MYNSQKIYKISLLHLVALLLIFSSIKSSSSLYDSDLTYQNYLFKSPQKQKEALKILENNLAESNEDYDSIFYPMKDAISYIFTKIESADRTVKGGESPDFKIEPKNVYFLEPKCESVTRTKSSDDNPLITFSNCSILIIIKLLEIKNGSRTIASFQDYLIEFEFNHMNFELKSNILFFLETKYNDFNYNRQESLFNIPSLSQKLKAQMDTLGLNAFSEYSKLFEQTAKGENEQSYLERFLGSIFNVLYMNGPFLNVTVEEGEDTSNKVTYISYSNPKMADIVVTAEKIFMSKMTIGFDYAIDFNINWNDGEFGLYDFQFSKEEGLTNSTRGFDFKAKNFNYPECVKEYIVNDFYEKFKTAQENYTKIGKNSESQ